ncbi:hypothetical protein [Ligaoa zhengdingensis]|uniref:hypothetical protein n=1 Tax=Ligaoa zhengdingensis TaxID=2763658 RepID=UPI0031BA9FA3
MANVMQYNDFSFRYNPRKIEVGYLRPVSVTDMPFSPALVREQQARPRVVKGEGELFGPSCAARFSELQAEFLRGGAGLLLCPLCEPIYAYFSSLRVVGEAGPAVLRYSFEFVEDLSSGAARGGIGGAVVYS